MVGKIRILVAIEDEIHLDRLCDHLEGKDNHFITERFSEKSAFAARMSGSGNKFDMVLFEPDMEEGVPVGQARQIKVRLGDENNFTPSGGTYTIKQYQRLDDITSALLRICSVDESFSGVVGAQNGQSDLYLVTSPTGGAGNTTVALGIAMNLATAGNRTLSINFEGVSALDKLLPAGATSISRIMHLCIEKSARLLTTIEGGKATEPLSGVEYFSAFKDIEDLESLKPEDIKSMVEQICGLGIYKNIVIDAQWNTRLNAPLMSLAKQIFVVTRNTEVSVAKTNTFLEQCFGKEAPYRNRVHVILNCASIGVNEALKTDPFAILPLFQMIVDAGNFAQTILGANPLGTAIKNMAQRLN